MIDVPDDVEDGEWLVWADDKDKAVVIRFHHFGDTGVETFVTAMEPEDAMKFARAVIRIASDIC